MLVVDGTIAHCTPTNSRRNTVQTTMMTEEHKLGAPVEVGDRVLLFDGSCFNINEPMVCLGGATIEYNSHNKHDVSNEKEWCLAYKYRSVRPDRQVWDHPRMEPGNERIDVLLWPARCMRKMTGDEMVGHPPNPRAVDRGKWRQHQFVIGDVVVLYSHTGKDGGDVLPNEFWDHTRWGGRRHSKRSYIAEEDKTAPHEMVGYAILIKKVNDFWYTTKSIGGRHPIADVDGRMHDYDTDLFEGIQDWHIANMEVALDEHTRLPMFVTTNKN